MVNPVVIKDGGNQRFSFNLEGNVGPNSANRTDDVQLVQFGYFAKARAPSTTPAMKAIYDKVVPGAPYSGAANDPLTLAIKAHQADRGGTQDGHVSAMPPGASLTYDGQHSFMILTLVNNILDITKTDFPRIDRHPSCPSVLRQRIKKVSIFE